MAVATGASATPQAAAPAAPPAAEVDGTGDLNFTCEAWPFWRGLSLGYHWKNDGNNHGTRGSWLELQTDFPKHL